ncbi:8-amino-7-oxononanoate synthase [bacterium]|nr:MAG: 8-amino-7-oxononanoate synthase [bacterium]
MVTIWHELKLELERRESRDLRRFLRAVPKGALDLASNDYLGLSTHPQVMAAASEAALKFGAGARASRLVSGNYDLITQLESALAHFKGCEAALVFSSGYAANIGVISALANSETALFCHKRNHASLIDACRFSSTSGATVRYFEKTDKLRSLLRSSEASRKIIVIDGVFSMDGDVIELPAILEIAREHDALILLDDAHGTGTLGATGRGTTEHFGMHDTRIVHIGTLSKALGSQGGFVAGPQVLIDFFINAARSFVYSTGLNPSAAGAALKALEIVEREPQRIEKCRINGRDLAEKLANLGFDVTPQPSPILPVILKNEKQALDASAQLLEMGLWCPAIRPPTVPTARLRLTVNAGWDEAELKRIVAGFAALELEN